MTAWQDWVALCLLVSILSAINLVCCRCSALNSDKLKEFVFDRYMDLIIQFICIFSLVMITRTYLTTPYMGKVHMHISHRISLHFMWSVHSLLTLRFMFFYLYYYKYLLFCCPDPRSCIIL